MNVRRVLAAAGVAAAVAVGGCGLPQDGSPDRIDPTSVPFGLLSPSSTTSNAPAVGPVAALYFVRNDVLVPHREHVSYGTNLPEAALRALLAGPTAQDVRHGATTAIPSQTRLISLDVHKTHATVDLNAPFGGVGGRDQVLAVGQIVLTLTAAPQISDVSFSIDGRPAEVPNGDGSLSRGPHRAKDFAAILR